MARVIKELETDESIRLDTSNTAFDEQVQLTLGGNNVVAVHGVYTTFDVTVGADVTEGSTFNLEQGAQVIVRSLSGLTPESPLTFNIGGDSWLNYGRNIDASEINATAINFTGSNASLRFIVSDPDLHLTAIPTITGLSRGNQIYVEQEWSRGVGYGLSGNGVSYDAATGLLTISGPGSDSTPVIYMRFRVQDALPEEAEFTIDDSGQIVYACFVRGTLLSTPDGQKPVQELCAGDLVCTANNGVATVKWVGFRTLHARQIRPADAIRAFPIRIARGALAPDIPRRDLYVSPGHHMYFDGKLVAAMLLVNGKTITQDFSRQSFEYFHVELDRFDILLAEGAAAESYVDTGNRAMFQNAHTVALSPDFGPAEGRPDIPGLEVIRSGPAVEAIRKRLLKRAEVVTASARVADPDLHIEYAGRIVRAERDPLRDSETSAPIDGVMRFVLPGGDVPGGAIPAEIRILSRSAIVRETSAHARRDLRRVGVGLARITIEDAAGRRDIDLNTVGLQGLHPIQDVRGTAMRWTDGAAAVPAQVHGITGGPAVLELHVLRTYSYWEPAARLSA